jgi:hypothetical protein
MPTVFSIPGILTVMALSICVMAGWILIAWGRVSARGVVVRVGVVPALMK